MTEMEKNREMHELGPILKTDDLVSLVKRLGFIPFFQNGVAGYSIDEATPARVWDEKFGLGPWLWRDDIAKDKHCIYGKFFHKKQDMFLWNGFRILPITDVTGMILTPGIRTGLFGMRISPADSCY